VNRGDFEGFAVFEASGLGQGRGREVEEGSVAAVDAWATPPPAAAR